MPMSRSKPGAPAVATALHHELVGLHKYGHGALLGEVMWTSSRVSSYLSALCTTLMSLLQLSAVWATLSDDALDFVLVPFNDPGVR